MTEPTFSLAVRTALLASLDYLIRMEEKKLERLRKWRKGLEETLPNPPQGSHPDAESQP